MDDALALAFAPNERNNNNNNNNHIRFVSYGCDVMKLFGEHHNRKQEKKKKWKQN